MFLSQFKASTKDTYIFPATLSRFNSGGGIFAAAKRHFTATPARPVGNIHFSILGGQCETVQAWSVGVIGTPRG
jgi:hypothetical protein